jgi:hypothetical protein
VFYPKQNILDYSEGGVIFIDFPNNFLIDFYSGKCDVDINYSFFSNCILENNRIFFNASNSEWDPSIKGKLNFTIYDISTPDDDGQTLNFIIGNYDNVTKKVLGRSYWTLNKGHLEFQYDGSQIVLNNEKEIYLEVGSYSEWFSIKLDEPATQSLMYELNLLRSLKILID